MWNENQLMSLFYSYIAGSLHVSGPQTHLRTAAHATIGSVSVPLCSRALCVVATTYRTSGVAQVEPHLPTFVWRLLSSAICQFRGQNQGIVLSKSPINIRRSFIK